MRHTCRPKALGEAPETRFRHTAVAAPLAPGSPLHAAVAAQLAGLGVASPPGSGTLLLLWGGYNTHNAQFGGPDIQVSARWWMVDCQASLLVPVSTCPAAACNSKSLMRCLAGADGGNRCDPGALGGGGRSRNGVAAADEHGGGAVTPLSPHRGRLCWCASINAGPTAHTNETLPRGLLCSSAVELPVLFDNARPIAPTSLTSCIA